jgi:hypothetical protein
MVPLIRAYFRPLATKKLNATTQNKDDIVIWTTLHCGLAHSDYRTVSPYWVLPVYVELIRAVWADDAYGDRSLLF